MGGHQGDHLLRIPPRPRQHAQNAFRRWGHQGESIGEALIEHEFCDIVGRGNGDPAGADRAVFSRCPEPVIQIWVQMLRGAARSPGRQRRPVHRYPALSECLGQRGRKPLPLLTDKAFHMGFCGGSVRAPIEGRDRLEVPGKTCGEIGIVQKGQGEAMPVPEDSIPVSRLSHHPDIGGVPKRLMQSLKQGRHQIAGLAILLGEADQRGPAGGEGPRSPSVDFSSKAGLASMFGPYPLWSDYAAFRRLVYHAAGAGSGSLAEVDGNRTHHTPITTCHWF